MNLGRIFASAIVRRLAYVFVALVLAWCGIGKAHAQERCGFTPIPAAVNPYPTLAAAMAACNAAPSQGRSEASGGWFNAYTGKSCDVVMAEQRVYLRYASAQQRNYPSCGYTPYQPVAGPHTLAYYAFSEGCPAGEQWFGGVFQRCDTACNARPGQTQLLNRKPGSQTCERGCMRSIYANGDGETGTTQSTGQQCNGEPNDCAAIPSASGNFFYNPYLRTCEPANPQCPEGMHAVGGQCAPNDFCPTGQILNSNNVCEPKEGECPAGTTRDLQGMCRSMDDDGDPNKCPAGQVKGGDGTCKPDENNDGEPDGDSDTGTFSGGESCKVPPMCAGDAIQCGQAKIQWRIDCNTRRNQKISGGGCAPNSMPVCVGESCDLMQYAQLMQAWNTRCAVEKLAREAGDGNGNGEGQGDPDFDGAAAGAGDANAIGSDGVTSNDAFTDQSANNGGAGGVPGGTGELDASGLGFTRGCPNLPSVTVLGTTVDFNSAGVPLCDWMRLGGQFVLIIAAVVAVRILASGGSA